MRDSRYQGSFDHPVRAFLIGVTLLVLLFGGFVVGIEAGTHPIEQAGATERVVTMMGSTKTVAATAPFVRTVSNGHTSVVRLPGSVRREVVGGKRIYVYSALEPASGGSSAVTDAGVPLLVQSTVTVTTPPVISTVTETVPTTVTETAPSSSDSSGSTTGP